MKHKKLLNKFFDVIKERIETEDEKIIVGTVYDDYTKDDTEVFAIDYIIGDNMRITLDKVKTTNI